MFARTAGTNRGGGSSRLKGLYARGNTSLESLYHLQKWFLVTNTSWVPAEQEHGGTTHQPKKFWGNLHPNEGMPTEAKIGGGEDSL